MLTPGGRQEVAMSEREGLRPAPWLTRDSAFSWEAAKREELVRQRCADCGVHERVCFGVSVEKVGGTL